MSSLTTTLRRRISALEQIVQMLRAEVAAAKQAEQRQRVRAEYVEYELAQAHKLIVELQSKEGND